LVLQNNYKKPLEILLGIGNYIKTIHKNMKKFISMKEWTRKEYGNSAIVGIILGGWLATNTSSIVLLKIAGDGLFLLGLLFGAMYIYKLLNGKQD
jgi:hypothetical protein